MIRAIAKITLGLGICAALAACGNQTDRGTLLKVVSGAIGKKAPSRAAPAGAPTQDQLKNTISEALAGTDRNLAIAVIEKRNAFAVLTQIETNGSVVTWASPDLRSLSTKGGLIVATRGLGFDIMSSDLGAVRALVSARREGTALRITRVLDGENQIREERLSCTITRGGAQGIAVGEIEASTIRMSETCRGVGESFENTYLVDDGGRVIQSRQWLGAENGYITWQALRL